jgi:DNA adenine methylase
MTPSLTPFLRWAGGKRWIAPHLAPVFRQVLTGRYVEPFVGSGAVFFALQPTRATLGDLNADLINVYEQVVCHAAQLERTLERMPVSKREYYSVRGSRPKRGLATAVRFIYLNRTCFGGLHRTNKQGEFNVPYGGGSRTPEIVYRDHLLTKCAVVLRSANVRLVAGDYGSLVDSADAGDVVFCDPTYRSAGRGRFDRYGPTVFSWQDQIRLARAALAAYSRGAVVVVMNVDEAEVAALYRTATAIAVEKTKCIGNRAKSTDRHREVLLVLDPLGHQDLWANLAMQLRTAGLAPALEASRGAA